MGGRSPAGALRQEVAAYAAKLNAKSPVALARALEAVISGGESSLTEGLRLEAGLAWGGDVAGDVLAMETGLEGAISFTKGCYIGQEFVVRIAHRGHVNRRLSGLILNGEGVPHPGNKVVAGEKEMGWITSAAFSPALGRPIALGYVRRECYELGSKVAVQVGDAAVDAEIVALPFLKTVR